MSYKNWKWKSGGRHKQPLNVDLSCMDFMTANANLLTCPHFYNIVY